MNTINELQKALKKIITDKSTRLGVINEFAHHPLIQPELHSDGLSARCAVILLLILIQEKLIKNMLLTS